MLIVEARKLRWLITFHILNLGGINMMAKSFFYEQISKFVRENTHLNARFVRVPTENPCSYHVAVVCDKLKDFIIPGGLKIEEQKQRYWLKSCYTREFLEIINRENEKEFFGENE